MNKGEGPFCSSFLYQLDYRTVLQVSGSMPLLGLDAFTLRGVDRTGFSPAEQHLVICAFIWPLARNMQVQTSLGTW